jgi:hypothetical protein
MTARKSRSGRGHAGTVLIDWGTVSGLQALTAGLIKTSANQNTPIRIYLN